MEEFKIKKECLTLDNIFIGDDRDSNKAPELLQVKAGNEWVAEVHSLKLGSFEDKVRGLFHKESNIIDKISKLELTRPGSDAHWHIADPELIHNSIDKQIMPLARDLIKVNEILRQIDRGIYSLPSYEVPINYR